MAIDEEPKDTIATGDDLLTLPASVPLALRLDAYAQLYANGKAATDFQLPFNLKLLSGGTLGKKLSYYVYFLLAERGEVAGIEDAFIYWNDIADAPVDLAVGQFQVSGSRRNGVPGGIWFASSPSAGSYTHQHTPHSRRVSSAMREPSPR